MKLGVAYCRVSTDKEEQQKSITEQKKQWEEFFKTGNIKSAKCGMLYKRNGSKEILSNGIYADEGISGTSLKNRKAFNQMIADAKLKKFDMIFVEDVSRFARSLEDGVKIIKDLREIGIGVYFRKEGWDTLNEEKDFEFSLRISIAQEESRVKSARIKWALDRLHKRGGWNSPPPYGYYRKDGTLHIKEEEKEIVITIYDLYVNKGYGTGKIARYLNNENILTKKGCKWSQIQIREILKNEIYTGKQVTHKTETADITRKLNVEVPKEEQIIHYKEELRIIDNDTFNKAQEEYKHRSEMFTYGTRHSNKFLLSTLLYCDNCGGAFIRKKRHSYIRKDGTSRDIGYEWTCGINDRYGANRCGQRNMLIEDKIIEQIKAELKTRRKEDLSMVLDLYVDKKQMKVGNNDKLTQERTSLVEEIRQLRKDYINKIYDEARYNEEAKYLNEKIADIDAEISRNDRVQYEIEKAKTNYNEYVKMLDTIDLDKLTNQELKNIFSKIVVKRRSVDGKKKIYINYQYKFLDLIEDDLLVDNGENFRLWYSVD